MQLGYTLDIDCSDFCALDNAVKPYLERCRAEIAAGNTYPFKHDLERLERVMQRLLASEEILSQYIPAKKPD
jgi:hypothetical protein